MFILFCICRYTSLEIKPEHKKNTLTFDYGIIFKCEGILAHSFDRFHVVTKFILPTIHDLKLSAINLVKHAITYKSKTGCSVEEKWYISDLTIYYSVTHWEIQVFR